MEKKNAIVGNNVVEKELRPLPGMVMLFVLIKCLFYGKLLKKPR